MLASFWWCYCECNRHDHTVEGAQRICFSNPSRTIIPLRSFPKASHPRCSSQPLTVEIHSDGVPFPAYDVTVGAQRYSAIASWSGYRPLS